jgi:uncharacterized protein with NAD-binding domain and iron-sulfur cluster
MTPATPTHTRSAPDRTADGISGSAPGGAPVVVVGAGIAGLTCALALARAGRRVLVLEREAEVGGRVRSRVVDGYTVDRGFQVLFTAYPMLAAALGLVGDADGGLRLRRFAPAARLVTRRGASLVGDALRDPRLFAPTVLAGALSPADKLRLLMLRRLAMSLSVDDCFAPAYDAVPAREFLRARGVSARAVSRFFAPFYGGILLDPALGTSAAVLLFTFKMLSEGDTAVPAAGMGDVARRLAEQLPAGTVRTGVAVEAVLAEGGRAAGVRTRDGLQIAAADVVLAVEAPAARRLAATVDAELAVPAGALGCTTVWFAAAGHEAPLPGRAIWLNAAGHEAAAARPPNDGGDAGGDDDHAPAVSHAVTMTEVAPEYAAPDARHGRHLVAATAVGAPATLDDGALVPRMRAELAAMRAAAGFDAGAALVPVAVDRVPYAQFAQPPGARARRTPASAGLPRPLAGERDGALQLAEGAARAARWRPRRSWRSGRSRARRAITGPHALVIQARPRRGHRRARARHVPAPARLRGLPGILRDGDARGRPRRHGVHPAGVLHRGAARVRARAGRAPLRHPHGRHHAAPDRRRRAAGADAARAAAGAGDRARRPAVNVVLAGCSGSI